MVSGKSEALCLVRKEKATMSPFFWEGGGGIRVGEVSERSVQQTHLGDCRCNYWWQLEAFFMALNDFYFSTLGLFTYTQCCAAKPVWAGGGGLLVFVDFCDVHIPQRPISSYQGDVTRQSWEKGRTVCLGARSCQHYLTVACSCGSAKVCTVISRVQ